MPNHVWNIIHLRQQRRRDMTTVSTSIEPLTDAEAFFYKHAGWSYDPARQTPDEGRRECARTLARAEVEAQARGWSVEWSPDTDAIWDDDVERETTDYDQYLATLYDDEGCYLTGIGSVDFGPTDCPEDEPYARVVAAELASEYLP